MGWSSPFLQEPVQGRQAKLWRTYLHEALGQKPYSMRERVSLLGKTRILISLNRTNIFISHLEGRGEPLSLGRSIGWVWPSAWLSFNIKLLGDIRAGERLLPAKSMFQEMGTGLQTKAQFLSMISVFVKDYSTNFTSYGKIGPFARDLMQCSADMENFQTTPSWV